MPAPRVVYVADMATTDLQEFRRQARDEIVAWMGRQQPPITRARLAEMLGYRPGQVSKALGDGRDTGSPAFLKRVAASIPELSWLYLRHQEIELGNMAESEQVREGRTKAETLQQIAQLEMDTIEAIRQAFAAARQIVNQ